MKLKLLLPLLLLVPVAALAQQPAAPAAYRIQLTLRQSQPGKAATVHTFSLSAAPGTPATLQAGDKIPVATSAGPGESAFTYQPVGITIRCALPASRDIPAGHLALNLTVQISSVVASPSGTVSTAPVFRNAEAQVSTTIPLGKATVVADFSDLDHEVSYQVQVLATPLP